MISIYRPPRNSTHYFWYKESYLLIESKDTVRDTRQFNVQRVATVNTLMTVRFMQFRGNYKMVSTLSIMLCLKIIEFWTSHVKKLLLTGLLLCNFISNNKTITATTSKSQKFDGLWNIHMSLKMPKLSEVHWVDFQPDSEWRASGCSSCYCGHQTKIKWAAWHWHLIVG